jgi:hypothetical protein
MKNASVNSIDANLRQVVYTSAIRNGGAKEWDFLWKKLLEERIDIEKIRIMKSLASAKDENLMNEFTNETLLQGNRIATVSRSLSSHKLGFRWMEDNFWDNLEENSGESFASLSEFAKGLSETAKDEEKTSVRSRFEKRVLEMAQGFKDDVQMNVVWGKENDCKDWLKRELVLSPI